MKAIILAAGVSRRLYPLTMDTPKSLLEVGGKPMLSYALDTFQDEGIVEVVIILGYYREKFIEYLERNYPEMNFQYIINHHYFETNTAYSLYLCRQELNENNYILLNADLIFPRQLLKRLIESKLKNVMAVEKKTCGDEEVKVIAGADNRIVAIGKELIQENALGEFLGIAKFDHHFMEKFINSLSRLIDAGGKADYFEAAIHPILADEPIHYIDCSDLPCIEIDFIEDLTNAQEMVKSEWYS
jgi:choline kinase